MVDRIHSSDTQVFINGIRFTGCQSFSTENTFTIENLQNFGSYDAYDRIQSFPQTPSVSMDFILIDTQPNNNTATAATIQDPFYSFQNSGILSIESFTISKKDLECEQTFSSGYLKSYNINCSVGNPLKGSISYDCNAVSLNQAAKLTSSSQTNDTGIPLLPRKIKISSNFEGVNSTGLHIQSFDLKVDLSREPIYIMGQKIPYCRYPKLPTEGSFSMSVIKGSISGMESPLTVLKKGNFQIQVYDCFNRLKLTYGINNCSLTSISEKASLDGNTTVDFNYVFSLNNSNALTRV